MSARLEMCCNCGNETGKAGRADDSIYVQSYGPLCEKCWDELRAEVIESSAPVESGTVSGELIAAADDLRSCAEAGGTDWNYLDRPNTWAKELARYDAARKAFAAPATPSGEENVRRD